MSAYICNPKHFAVLGHFSAQRRFGGSHNVCKYWMARELKDPEVRDLTDLEYANLIANILYQENIRSVLHRYPNCDLESAPGPIDKPEVIHVNDWSRTELGRKPVEILMACDGLEYQSCETEDWEETIAYQILNAIRSSAIQQLPGYDEAEWSIEDEPCHA